MGKREKDTGRGGEEGGERRGETEGGGGDRDNG